MNHDVLDLMRKVDLFKDLHPKHAKHVAPLIEIREIRTGEEIVREGAYCGEFFFIVSGSADVTVRGKHRTTVGPGEFFGEVALLGHSQSATVKALDEMRVGVVDAKQLYALLDSEPTIAVHMLESLILRHEELMTRPIGQLS